MSRCVLVLALVALLAQGALPVLAVGSSTDGGDGAKDEGTPQAAGGRAMGIAIWHPDRVLDAGALLVGVAAGDLVPDRPGNETVAGDRSGRLWLAWRENHTWRSRVAWTVGGNLTSLAAGELDSGSPGLEVACGVAFANGTGAVCVASALGDQTAARTIMTSAACITAVAAGDVITGIPGMEIVAVDDGGNVSVAFPNSPAKGPQNIIRIPGATCLLVAELDGSSPGEELAIGTSSGELVELFWDGGAWQEKGLWVSPSAIACLAFGDADPLHDGPELAMASDPGEITLLERLGDVWSGRAVRGAGGTISALAVGDADADSPGNELWAGCPDNVSRLRWDGNAWARAQVWGGSGPLRALLVAEVDPDHNGTELLAAGASGFLTALGLYHPGFVMSAGTSRQSLAGGETASFGLVFTPLDKLGGNLSVTVGDLPAGITVANGTGPVALMPPGVNATLGLSINASIANGEYRFLVTASHEAGLFDSLWLTVVLDRRLDLKVALTTRNPETQPGASKSYTVTVTNAGTVNDSYVLDASVEGGWKVRFPAGNLTGTVAPGGNRSLELVVSVPDGVAGRTARLTVNAASQARSNLTRSASMKVIVPQKSAACGLVILPVGLAGTAFLLGRKGNKREKNQKRW